MQRSDGFASQREVVALAAAGCTHTRSGEPDGWPTPSRPSEPAARVSWAGDGCDPTLECSSTCRSYVPACSSITPTSRRLAAYEAGVGIARRLSCWSGSASGLAMGWLAELRADRRGGTSPSSRAAYTSPISLAAGSVPDRAVVGTSPIALAAGSVADRAVVGTRTAYTSLAARAPYSDRQGVTESFRVLGSIATGRASASKKAMSKQAE